jgi:hypothetical protein
VRRIPLIRREIRERLSPNALDLLFSRAELVVEGDSEPGYATVMVTIDLETAADELREPADAATAMRVAELMNEAPEVRSRLLALAQLELSVRFGTAAERLRIGLEHTIRAEGCRILIDGDVTAEIRSASARRG